jgi:lipopolysaccharide heptosyltransferase II
MTTLVHLPNWVGDALLALPALRAIADAKSAQLVLAGRALPLSLTREIAPDAPRIELSEQSTARGLLSGAAAIRARHCTRGLLLTPSFSSALQLRLAGARERIGWVEQGRAALLTRRVARSPRGSLHLCDEFKDLARLLGAGAFEEVPHLPADEAQARAADDLLCALRRARPRGGGPIIALCPGARYGPAKQWPIERFAQLARQLTRELGARGLVVGAANEREAAAAILAAAGADDWHDATGAGPIRFAAELLRRCDAAVCNDSGAMHLAAAVATPVVALFGPSDPRWTAPLGPRHQIVREACDCAPCFRRRCSRADPPPCMTAIAPDAVVERMRALLSGDAEAYAAALILDRDGTLIELEPYLCAPQRVRLVPGAAAVLRSARERGMRIVVVSNQSGVARGLYSTRAVEAVQARVRELLAREGAQVDRFYHCPHHPRFTGRCACRKPAPGMLRLAAMELGLDLTRSFMLGDTIEDLIAGHAAGCRPVLVRTGHGEEHHALRRDQLPPGTLVAAQLAEAWARITSQPEIDSSEAPT